MTELILTGLKIQNYMGVELLEINPTGVVTVKGKNGVGKSTVLDAIYYAIIGGKSVEQPIKEGTKKAVITVTLGGIDRELILTRTITQKSNTLKVVDNGENKTKASELLKGLLNKISIDPQKFLLLPKKEQVELMAKVCKVEFDFDKELVDYNSDVEERRAKKRDITDIETRISHIDLPKELPAVLPSMKEATDELQEAVRFNSEQDSKNLRILSLKNEIDGFKQTNENLKNAYEINLKQLLDNFEIAKKNLLGKYKSDKEDISLKYEESKDILEAIGDIAEHKNIEVIQKRIELAEFSGQLEIKKNYETDLKTQKKALTEIETKIYERKDRKEKALSNASIPIDGLITDGECLILNNIPFEQASTAERIKVATTLAIKANKTLKLINIKDATLLDKESLQTVIDVAKANNCQLFMEVVSDDEEIVIEFS